MLGYYSTYFPLEWNAAAAPESGGGRGSLFSPSLSAFLSVRLCSERLSAEEEGVRGRSAAAVATGPPLVFDLCASGSAK